MNNHLSPQIIEHKKDHNYCRWYEHKNVVVLNQLMGFQACALISTSRQTKFQKILYTPFKKRKKKPC
jgi:hypothetical protein